MKRLTAINYGRAIWRVLPVLLAVFFSVLALDLLGRFVERAGDAENPITELELMFFSILTLAAGSGLSWLISAYYARGQARDQYEQLARPALRRVVAAKESALALSAAISRRSEAAQQSESPIDAGEAFASLGELVDQHARVLDDAITDWREILPDEVQSIITVDRQLSVLAAQQQSSQSQLQQQIAEVQQTVSKLAAAKAVTPAELQRVEAELEKVAKQAKERPYYPTIGGGVLTGTIDGGGVVMREPAKSQVTINPDTGRVEFR
jgi:DNA-binding protein H-NS